MKVHVKSLLRPAHFLAFALGYCPYRKYSEGSYRRSTLGTVLQLINVVLTTCIWIYIVIFYVPKHVGTSNTCSTLKMCSFLILQTNHIVFSFWLVLYVFIRAPKMLCCLKLVDELSKMICRASNSKHRPLAFYFVAVWTMILLSKLLDPTPINPMVIAYDITTFSTLYCETLLLEFITIIRLALETINQTLETYRSSNNYKINDFKTLQSLYLRAADVAKAVDDNFGINWVISFFDKSCNIVLPFYWLVQWFDAAIFSLDKNTHTTMNMPYAYISFRVAANLLHFFYICYSLDQPSVKRSEMVSILQEMIVRNSNDELAIKMNEFTLQIALREIQFTAGGFFNINLRNFGEIVGMWCTVLVIMLQFTTA